MRYGRTMNIELAEYEQHLRARGLTDRSVRNALQAVRQCATTWGDAPARRVTPRMVDEAFTATNKVRAVSGIPGWSEKAPPKRDVFGDAVKHSRGQFLGNWSAFPDSTSRYAPVAEEMDRLAKLTRSVPSVAVPRACVTVSALAPNVRS